MNLSTNLFDVCRRSVELFVQQTGMRQERDGNTRRDRTYECGPKNRTHRQRAVSQSIVKQNSRKALKRKLLPFSGCRLKKYRHWVVQLEFKHISMNDAPPRSRICARTCRYLSWSAQKHCWEREQGRKLSACGVFDNVYHQVPSWNIPKKNNFVCFISRLCVNGRSRFWCYGRLPILIWNRTVKTNPCIVILSWKALLTNLGGLFLGCIETDFAKNT